jgi:transposase
MVRPLIISNEEYERARYLRENHDNEREYRRSLITLFLYDGRYTEAELAKIFNVTPRTISNEISKIRCPPDQASKKWGGHKKRLLSCEDEKAFLEKWEDQAKKGLIITASQMHVAFNETVGKITSKATFYAMLKRNNWRKALPDAKHPKGYPIIQEELKKNSRYAWITPSGLKI